LSKANVSIEGQENIPSGPTIFVVNHFTRIETLLIPYYIYQLTGVPALSMASDTLFKGRLKKYFELVGVVSTRDPHRDTIIIKSLLTGAENWIIFPEGRMVKSKKIIGGGSFLVTHSEGRHKPHTGAASLALRTEFYRNHLLRREHREPENVERFLRNFGLHSLDKIRGKCTSIVPVNLTYYPIRAKENIASQFASRIMKEVPERVLEELMTEGTMLFSGVDLDIHFGSPLTMDDFLEIPAVQHELDQAIDHQGSHGSEDSEDSKDSAGSAGSKSSEPRLSGQLGNIMRSQANEIMQRYMSAIYGMTTINHEHLFASFLERYPFSKMSEMGLRRRVYLAAKKICDKNTVGCNLHRSLKEDQVHLLTDDRFKKAENFLTLALEKGVIGRAGDTLVKTEKNIPDLLQLHRKRRDNPIDVMVNEVEPLRHIQKLVRSVAWQPDFLIKRRIVKTLIAEEMQRYNEDCRGCSENGIRSGGAYLLRGSTKKMGVVLVHSYLSIPEEVEGLARYLNRQGLWVYVPRLAGHGTSVDDLSQTAYSAWQHSVERGYAIINGICRKVVLGGLSLGGCLALDLASRLKDLAGVVAVCPPLRIKDYSTVFMPSNDVWKRIVAKLRRDDLDVDFFRFSSENAHSNYDRNPVLGVKNVESFLEKLRPALEDVAHPSLIIHADEDPVVDKAGSLKMYKELGAEQKEYMLLHSTRHIVTSGPEAGRVHRIIASFIGGVT
ncbi:MAG: alpha/beta fold hydrolase, partial [Desulfopila sp.]